MVAESCPIGHCCGGPCQEYGYGTHKAKHVVEAIHKALGAPPMGLEWLRSACAVVDIAHETAAAAERARIVAFLTARTVAYGEQPRLDYLIDAIERGEHEGGAR